jgi:methylglyoxal synthase
MKLALIAHDGKKADMVSFVMKRLSFFNEPSVQLVATGTTGQMLLDAGIDKIQRVASGPMGGDAEIGAMVSRGEMDAIIFFRDPLDKHPHDVDISMLMRLCDVHNIPLATNQKTAKIVVSYYDSTLD